MTYPTNPLPPTAQACADLVDLIGDGGECGYLVTGEWTDDQARAIARQALPVLSCWDCCTEAEADDLLADCTPKPGWYRKNPPTDPEVHTWDLGDGTPGQRGSFQAVFLERRW